MAKQLPVLKKEQKVKTRSSRKLLYVLLVLFIVILVVLFFRSSLSKVSEIRVAGNQIVSSEQLANTSGIRIGDQYFGTSTDTIRERLLTNKAIEDADVSRDFPGVIHIQVKEYPTVAYELSAADGKIQGILANGTSIAMPGRHVLDEKPILTQWTANEPLKAELCKQLASIPNEMLTDISEIIPYPSTSYPDRIKIYTRSQFEVVTAISFMKEKVKYLSNVIETQQPGLITMLSADTYIPFDQVSQQNDSEKETTQ